VILAAECLEVLAPRMILLAFIGVGFGLGQGEARSRRHGGNGQQEGDEAAKEKAWHPPLKIARVTSDGGSDPLPA